MWYGVLRVACCVLRDVCCVMRYACCVLWVVVCCALFVICVTSCGASFRVVCGVCCVLCVG